MIYKFLRKVLILLYLPNNIFNSSPISYFHSLQQPKSGNLEFPTAPKTQKGSSVDTRAATLPFSIKLQHNRVNEKRDLTA
jgi:hypothetical protein